MRNSNKTNALLNAVTLLSFGSALLVSVHAFAADVGGGVGAGGAVNGNRGTVGVGVNGGLDRGTGAVGVGNGVGIGTTGTTAGAGTVDANGGVIASPPETRGNINGDGTISVDRDNVGQRADSVRRKTRDTTRKTTSDTQTPNSQLNGEASGAAGVGVGK